MPDDPGSPRHHDDSANRLAELVSELTGTPPASALHAVRNTRPGRRDALEVVADAMVTVDQPPPEGFRLPGFLRTDGTTDTDHAADEASESEAERPEP